MRIGKAHARSGSYTTASQWIVGRYHDRSCRRLTYEELCALEGKYYLAIPSVLDPYDAMYSLLTDETTSKLSFPEFVRSAYDYFGRDPQYSFFSTQNGILILHGLKYKRPEIGDVGFVLFIGKVWDLLLMQVKDRMPEQYQEFCEQFGRRPLQYDLAHSLLKPALPPYDSMEDDYKSGMDAETVVDKIYSTMNPSYREEADRLAYHQKPLYVLNQGKPSVNKITTEWQDKNQKEEVSRLLKDGRLHCSVFVTSRKVELNEVNDGLSITFFFAEKLELNRESGKKEYTFQKTGKYVLFDNWELFREIRFKRKGVSKLVPAQVGEFIHSLNVYHCKALFPKILSAPVIRKELVFRDVWEDYRQSVRDNTLFPPIQWNACFGYHNRLELAQKLWKKADPSINWNKIGLVRGYALMKTIPYVDEESKAILNNAIHSGEIAGAPTEDIGGFWYKLAGKGVAKALVQQYLDKRIEEPGEDTACQLAGERDYTNLDFKKTEIRDYVESASKAGIALNIHQRSLRKLMDKTVQIEMANQRKLTPQIRIPKKSKFHALRQILPDDFEWIQTKQRIIRESVTMHNCVSSYAYYINEDTCAIYHLSYRDKDYTLEFKRNDKDK